MYEWTTSAVWNVGFARLCRESGFEKQGRLDCLRAAREEVGSLFAQRDAGRTGETAALCHWINKVIESIAMQR